jgi:hypothetical protein
MALVRERTIPAERPPLVGEVSANFYGLERCRVVSTADPLQPYSRFLDQSRYFFFQVAPQLYSRGGLDPAPDLLLLRESSRTGNRTRDVWICSQEL